MKEKNSANNNCPVCETALQEESEQCPRCRLELPCFLSERDRQEWLKRTEEVKRQWEERQKQLRSTELALASEREQSRKLAAKDRWTADEQCRGQQAAQASLAVKQGMSERQKEELAAWYDCWLRPKGKIDTLAGPDGDDAQDPYCGATATSIDGKQRNVIDARPRAEERPKQCKPISVEVSGGRNSFFRKIVGAWSSKGQSEVSELQVNDRHFRMEFVPIPAGRFLMGSPYIEGRRLEELPVHEVHLESFSMGRYQVTQEQWQAVMGTNPSKFRGAKRPVEQVSWDDVQEFIRHLNRAAGRLLFRLPSEAEWEYACRAGSKTVYCFGDDESRLGEYAWLDGNSGAKTHPVGRKKANTWGCHDMHGNVWEWCQDSSNYYYLPYKGYEGAPVDGTAWESGEYERRMVRGSSWKSGGASCRAACRLAHETSRRIDILGFRLVSLRCK